MAYSRPDIQVETLLAMVKRNQAVPELSGCVDIDALSDVMLNRFRSLLIPEADEVLGFYSTNFISPNTVAVRNWLSVQPPIVQSMIAQPSDILVTDHSLYNFKIKPTVKPQLDTTAPYTYPALQTIAYSEKWVNANYCPMFKELTARLVPLLRSNILINIGMSTADLSRRLTEMLGGESLDGATSLEVDMSKYDKSQGELMLKFEEKFLRMMGFDPLFVDAWLGSHTRTTLLDRSNKVSCQVSYQRKSGDASTFIMNTVFLMAVMSSLLPVEDAKLACFGGDDSLIVGDDGFNVNLSSITAELFNLESKYFRHYAYPYFCSKFIITDSERNVHVIPDPVKLVTKLGRHDLVNWDHMEQYRVSLCDLTDAYSNAALYDELNQAVCERYMLRMSIGYVFPIIYNVCRSHENFRNLYYTENTDVLCMDPSLPKFD